MAPTWTPRPIWAGLTPPVVAFGAPADRRVWLRVSSNSTELDLKPVVLTLAMLFDTTSINSWCARRPLMPENRERSTEASWRWIDPVPLGGSDRCSASVPWGPIGFVPSGVDPVLRWVWPGIRRWVWPGIRRWPRTRR